MPYDIRPCALEDVKRLCAEFHAYKDAGDVAVVCQAVYECGRIVAAFSWLPPPAGAALAVGGPAAGGVLALSRMIAVPKAERPTVRHISKPLRFIMRDHIDRTRWPILVTYSDESVGHTGYVYKCSGWKPTDRNKSAAYEDGEGVRTSSYSAGVSRADELVRIGDKWTQRWEHWISPDPLAYMTAAGWRRVPVPGKRWKSGNQAFTWVRDDPAQPSLPGLGL